MKKINKFLKYIDIFGNEVHFYINGSKSHKTITGGILSLILIIFSCFISIFNLYQFFTKRSLNIGFQTQFSKDFEPIQLTNDTYSSVYHFLINSPELSPFNDFNYDIIANYDALSTPSSLNLLNIRMDDCSNSNVIDKMSNLIDNNIERRNIFSNLLKASKTLCPVLSDDKNYYLGGDIIYSGIETFIKTNFTVSFCNKTCNSDYLDKLTKSQLYFNMLLLDSYSNMTIPEGLSKFVNLQGFYVDFTKNYDILIVYQNNRLITDEGYFYATPINNTSFLQFKSYNQDLTKRSIVDGDINFSITIQMDRLENVYTRTYGKLDALFANISALCTVVGKILSLLDKFLNFNKLSIHLINKFFHLTEKKEDKNNHIYLTHILNNVGSPGKSKEINNSQKIIPQDLSLTQFIFKKNMMKEIESINNNRITSRFNTIFCNSKKLFIGNYLIRYYLDVSVILKKLFDLENIKYLLFSRKEEKVLKLFKNNILMDNFEFNYYQNFENDNFLHENINEEMTEKKFNSISKLLSLNKPKMIKKIRENFNLDSDMLQI